MTDESSNSESQLHTGAPSTEQSVPEKSAASPMMSALSVDPEEAREEAAARLGQLAHVGLSDWKPSVGAIAAVHHAIHLDPDEVLDEVPSAALFERPENFVELLHSLPYRIEKFFHCPERHLLDQSDLEALSHLIEAAHASLEVLLAYIVMHEYRPEKEK